MKKLFEFSDKHLLKVLTGLVLMFLGLLALQGYRRHVPVVFEGACICFSLSGPMLAEEVACGGVVSNNLQYGSMTVSTLGPVKGELVKLRYIDLRDYGFIKAKCPAN